MFYPYPSMALNAIAQSMSSYNTRLYNETAVMVAYAARTPKDKTKIQQICSLVGSAEPSCPGLCTNQFLMFPVRMPSIAPLKTEQEFGMRISTHSLRIQSFLSFLYQVGDV